MCLRAMAYFGTFLFTAIRLQLLHCDLIKLYQTQLQQLCKSIHLPSHATANPGSLTNVPSAMHRLRFTPITSNSKSAPTPYGHMHPPSSMPSSLTTSPGRLQISEPARLSVSYLNSKNSTNSIDTKLVSNVVIIAACIVLLFGLIYDVMPIFGVCPFCYIILTELPELFAWLCFGVLLLRLYQHHHSPRALQRTCADDCYMFAEFAGLWLVWCLAISLQLAIFLLFQCGLISLYYGPMALFSFVWQGLNLSIWMMARYKTCNIQKESKSQRQTQSLSAILAAFRTLRQFTTFSADEASIENIAFLVEVWQFKYQHAHNLRTQHSDFIWRNPHSHDRRYLRVNTFEADKEEERTLKQLEKRKQWNLVYQRACLAESEESSNEHEADLVYVDVNYERDNDSETDHDSNSDIIHGLQNPEQDEYAAEAFDTDLGESSRPMVSSKFHVQYASSREISTPLCLFSQTSEEKRKHCMGKLANMPWSDIPLNYAIWRHSKNKYKQCVEIFNKYILRDAEYSLNISGGALRETEFAYLKCMKHYKENKANASLSTARAGNSKSRCCSFAFCESREHSTEDQILHELLSVFDNVIPDIFDNLDNIHTRYVIQQSPLKDENA
eukprot:CAMPEP_0197027498 /NCGR_PEP_ID=MMETSP1384-20130603/7395_1 /TAXON_ID=29189 /ORGANISM="Ammonia sp." /LENGTH=611 /DNA_ID=CAMNT_0042456353 /DNA_START=255 /DNA_END=2090 /DNA_ORIENTATION=+